MKISVVVPFYNEEKHIEVCVKALLSQDYPPDDYEVILVDNNSTDRSVDIVQRYPRVRLMHEPKQGDYAARNRGIEASTGTIIAFTDSDTAPYTDWLQHIERAMIDPTVSLIVGRLTYAPGSLSLAMVAAYEFEKAVYVYSNDIKEIYYGYTCNMAVRKSMFEQLGLFPAIYRNADTVFLRKVLDTFSCDAVRYAQDVRVQRLEISSLWQYYSKHHTYGKDLIRYSKIASLRPLTITENLEIFRRTVKRRGLSLTQSAFLFVLLSIGGVSYDAGRLITFGRKAAG